jgi:hypothetical protein
LRRRSKSGRKRPGKGSDKVDKGVAAGLILQIRKPRALTGLNFWSVSLFHFARGRVTTATDYVGRGVYRVKPPA